MSDKGTKYANVLLAPNKSMTIFGHNTKVVKGHESERAHVPLGVREQFCES